MGLFFPTQQWSLVSSHPITITSLCTSTNSLSHLWAECLQTWRVLLLVFPTHHLLGMVIVIILMILVIIINYYYYFPHWNNYYSVLLVPPFLWFPIFWGIGIQACGFVADTGRHLGGSIREGMGVGLSMTVLARAPTLHLQCMLITKYLLGYLNKPWTFGW